jgi:hypothetical protein
MLYIYSFFKAQYINNKEEYYNDKIAIVSISELEAYSLLQIFRWNLQNKG